MEGGGFAANEMMLLTVELTAVARDLDGDEVCFHGKDDFFVAVGSMAIVQQVWLDVPMSVKDVVPELEEEGFPLIHVGGASELDIETMFKAPAEGAVDSGSEFLIVFGVQHRLLNGRPAFGFKKLRIEGGLVSVDDRLTSGKDVGEDEGEGSSLLVDCILLRHCLTINCLASSEFDTILEVESPQCVSTRGEVEWSLLKQLSPFEYRVWCP